MPLFAALKKMRDFERQQLPFIKSLIDYDIIIEIGYAQELRKPLTPKPLFLMALGSATTVRRRLARLIEQGIVKRSRDEGDRRSNILTLSPSSLKLLGKYGKFISEMSLA
jgi:DNA-binding MarR family transcriptional regulator